MQGTLPSYRFYSTLSWSNNGWTAQLANTLVSAVSDIGPGGIVFASSTTLRPLHVPSYLAWDARISYDGQAIFGEYGKGWNFAIGVNNFTDQTPPLAPQAFTDNNVDVSTYSPNRSLRLCPGFGEIVSKGRVGFAIPRHGPGTRPPY